MQDDAWLQVPGLYPAESLGQNRVPGITLNHEHASPAEMLALQAELSHSSATVGGNVIGNFHQIAEEDDDSVHELDLRDPFVQTEVAPSRTDEQLAVLSDTLELAMQQNQELQKLEQETPGRPAGARVQSVSPLR